MIELTLQKAVASSRLRSHKNTETGRVTSDVYSYTDSEGKYTLPSYEDVRYKLLDKMAAEAKIFGDSSAAFRIQSISTGVVTFVMTLTEVMDSDTFANAADEFMYTFGFKTFSVVRKHVEQDAYAYYFRVYSCGGVYRRRR